MLGLVTALIGGLVVGTLGGAHLQISGPSAGLTVLVLAMVAEHGLGTFGVIVIFAGPVQVVAGSLKLGRYLQAVSGVGSLPLTGVISRNTAYVDHACIDLLNVFESRYETSGGEVIVEWDGLMHRYKTSGRPVIAEDPEGSGAS